MLNWAEIDTVLLDMDGTLLDLHFDNYFWLEYLPARYAERMGVTVREARDDLFPRMQRVRGTIDWYCLDYWSGTLGVNVAAHKREIGHLVRFRPGAQRFLAELARRGKRRVLVTNAHHDALALKLERTALRRCVEHIICAHDFRVPKEEQEFWYRLQEVQPFDPARTVLLDDSPGVLSSAKRYGIAHQLGIRRPDTTRPPVDWKEFPAVEAFEDLFAGSGELSE